MSRRPARRATGEGLQLHLISGDVVRLRRFEALRVLRHRYILGLYLLMWVALTLADPSGQSATAALSVRLPQYAAGVLVVASGLYAIFAVSEWLFGGKGRPVVLHDWPIVLAVSMLGLLASEVAVVALTGENRTSAKVFFVLSVFYFVIIEVNYQIVTWLLLPRILAELRATPGTEAEAEAEDNGPVLLRAGGHSIAPETIQHIEAQGNYVAIVTDTAQYEVPGPFSGLIDQIPAGLGLRVHRSHWVARRAVTGHRRKAREMMLSLAYGGEATVAIPRHAEVLDWLARTSAPDAARADADRPRPEDAARRG